MSLKSDEIDKIYFFEISASRICIQGKDSRKVQSKSHLQVKNRQLKSQTENSKLKISRMMSSNIEIRRN